MKQGDLIEISIKDLNHTGDGVGRYQGQVIFVPDTVIGDTVEIRIGQVKRHYCLAKTTRLIQPSPYRIRPRCIVADKCGGCQWQHIDDSYQTEVKRGQLLQSLQKIGGFSAPAVGEVLTGVSSLGYRNKVTYPLGMSATGKVQAGYYRRGTHQIINLNQCPVQDVRLNPLLASIKNDIKERGWPIYDEKTRQGQLRHLGLRIGRRTGEILLTLVTTDPLLTDIDIQAQKWLTDYPDLAGVVLNINHDPGNVIFGKENQLVAGRDYLTEVFGGLTYRLGADTFFQVNTEAAEALLDVIIDRLDLKPNETLLDAYCGIGTFTLPLAQKVARAIGIEIHAHSLEQARLNAGLNSLFNTTFYSGTVEDILPGLNLTPDVVILDPPRQGCDRSVLQSLLQCQPRAIVYISCQGATLARDLKILCDSAQYTLNFVQPADFFPQTAHLECCAFLEKQG
ncbi:MAG: 23S rRNA (uracil(1939)-C(5))-methyltransferase RlmD [Chlorogloea purpurea SAG 13.99]|nr:23S rRNA (uracil(1939)-C(5))-methyltransferase RlmD [Chlorogloea purpurea SAG 13.99]